jgi:hypothetical protein
MFSLDDNANIVDVDVEVDVDVDDVDNDRVVGGVNIPGGGILQSGIFGGAGSD